MGSRMKGGGKLDLWAGHGLIGREWELGSCALPSFSGVEQFHGGKPPKLGDPISIRFRSATRFRSDFDPISIRFGSANRFRSDFDPILIREPISIRFRSDFDPISIRFRSDSDRIPDPIPIRFRSGSDPTSIRHLHGWPFPISGKIHVLEKSDPHFSLLTRKWPFFDF